MLKKVFTTACVIFTVLVALYSLINLGLYSSDSESYLALSSLRVALFFPLALAVSCANQLFTIKAMDSWLKVSLHFIITMLAVYLCLVLPIGADLSSTSLLMGMLMFVLLYAIIATVALFFRAKARREENDKQDYTPVYKKSTDKK